MFTGIVQAKGVIESLERQAMGLRLCIDRQGWNPQGIFWAKGDSVCVSGVCLTLVEFDARLLRFDVIAETLAKTTLGRLQPGSRVNLEPCLTPVSQLGGHIVQGHVDAVGRVKAVIQQSGEFRLRIAPPVQLMEYLVPKGSVALDGVSLTLACVNADDFEVALIPTTLELTTLGGLKAGDAINIETDILSKTVVHWLRRQQQGEGSSSSSSLSSLSLDTLKNAGF